MKSMLDQALNRTRERNQPIELQPMKMIELLVTTNKGWLIRQLLKWTAAAGTTITTWLLAKGVAIDNPEAVTAAISTLAVGVAEMGLSKMASKHEAK